MQAPAPRKPRVLDPHDGPLTTLGSLQPLPPALPAAELPTALWRVHPAGPPGRDSQHCRGAAARSGVPPSETRAPRTDSLGLESWSCHLFTA